MNKKQGFTLVEILVVISIIGLLANIVSANVFVARQKSRDVRTLDTIAKVQQSLDIFYGDFGEYPEPDGWDKFCSNDANQFCINDGDCSGGATCVVSWINVGYGAVGPLSRSGTCLDSTGFGFNCNNNPYINSIPAIHDPNSFSLSTCWSGSPDRCMPIYVRDGPDEYQLRFRLETETNGMAAQCWRAFSDHSLLDCL